MELTAALPPPADLVDHTRHAQITKLREWTKATLSVRDVVTNNWDQLPPEVCRELRQYALNLRSLRPSAAEKRSAVATIFVELPKHNLGVTIGIFQLAFAIVRLLRAIDARVRAEERLATENWARALSDADYAIESKDNTARLKAGIFIDGSLEELASGTRRDTPPSP